jgi:hypothetical protein
MIIIPSTQSKLSLRSEGCNIYIYMYDEYNLYFNDWEKHGKHTDIMKRFEF